MRSNELIRLEHNAALSFEQELPDLAEQGVHDERVIDRSRLAIQSSMYGDWYLYDNDRLNKPIMRIVLFEELDMTIEDLTEEELRIGKIDLIDRMMDYNDVTIEELAERIGRKLSTVERYFKCYTRIPDKTLHKIAELLECTVEDLTPKDYIPYF